MVKLDVSFKLLKEEHYFENADTNKIFGENSNKSNFAGSDGYIGVINKFSPCSKRQTNN